MKTLHLDENNKVKNGIPIPFFAINRENRKMIALFSTNFDFDLIVPPTPVIKAPPATEGPKGLGTPGFLGGGITGQKMSFSHPFSDLPSKIHTHFQTWLLRSYVIIT